MLGHSHALSGAVAGLGAGMLAGLGPAHTAELGLLTAGAALLPDLDSVGSCSARQLGWLSRLPAYLIRLVSGGHRHATHSILGVAAFSELALIAGQFRHDLGGKIGLGFLVALIVAGGLDALRLCRGQLADVAGLGAAGLVVFYGIGLQLVPAAVAFGCVAHLAGDMLTDSGVPLLFPWMHRFRWWPEPFAFTTGTRPELLLVDPLLVGAMTWLTWAGCLANGSRL